MRICNEGYPKPSLKQDGEMMHLGCRSATRCLQMASKHQLGLPGCSLVYWKVQRMSAWLHGFVLASMESHLALSPELPLHLPSHSLGGDFSPISHFEKFAWGSHWGYFILRVEVFSLVQLNQARILQVSCFRITILAWEAGSILNPSDPTAPFTTAALSSSAQLRRARSGATSASATEAPHRPCAASTRRRRSNLPKKLPRNQC